MRILMLSWRDRYHPLAGGAEIYTDEILTRLASRGHQVVLRTSQPEGFASTDHRNGYDIVRGGGTLSVYSQGRRWFTKNAKAFDVVIDQVNTVPFLPVDPDRRVRTVGMFHQTAEEVWVYNLPKAVGTVGRHVIEPYWLRKFRKLPIIALSESTRNALQRFQCSNVMVAGVGVTGGRLEQPRMAEVYPPRVVSVSRLVRAKRIDALLEAVQIARSKVPNLELDVIGSGKDRRRLERQAPLWAHFHGAVDEATRNRIVGSASLHIMSSVREGWGLVVTEAALAGTPTVAMDTPGVRDSTLAANGWLTPPEPRALGAWIGSIIDSGLQQVWKSPLRGGADTWETVTSRIETFISSVVTHGGGK